MGRFFRWVPREHASTAVESGLISHNGSAMWIFSMGEGYRPSGGISHGSCLLAYELDEVATLNVTTREHLDFEHESFKGEGKHPRKVIVKSNEPGAYGLGVMRQRYTNFHTTAGYATKKEVAKALGLREIEVSETYKPPGGWP